MANQSATWFKAINHHSLISINHTRTITVPRTVTPYGPIDSPFAARGPLIEGKAEDQPSGGCRAEPADDKAHSDGARGSACCAALPSPRKPTSSCRVASWEPQREVLDARKQIKSSVACFYSMTIPYDTATWQRKVRATSHLSARLRHLLGGSAPLPPDENCKC